MITLFFSNIKYILLGGAAILGMMLFWNYVSITRENAMLHTTIDMQTIAIESKDQIIKNLQLSFDIAMNSIEARDALITELEGELDGILVDLGDDYMNQAPESIKELLKRLRR